MRFKDQRRIAKAAVPRHRNKWKCAYCGVQMRPSSSIPHPRARTWDHVIPKSQGGTWRVRCCFACNQAKRNMSVADFVSRGR